MGCGACDVWELVMCVDHGLCVVGECVGACDMCRSWVVCHGPWAISLRGPGQSKCEWAGGGGPPCDHLNTSGGGGGPLRSPSGVGGGPSCN